MKNAGFLMCVKIAVLLKLITPKILYFGMGRFGPISGGPRPVYDNL